LLPIFSPDALYKVVCWFKLLLCGSPAGGEAAGAGSGENRLPDQIRDIVFGPHRGDGPALATVTLFERDVRIATNVVTAKAAILELIMFLKILVYHIHSPVLLLASLPAGTGNSTRTALPAPSSE